MVNVNGWLTGRLLKGGFNTNCTAAMGRLLNRRFKNYCQPNEMSDEQVTRRTEKRYEQ